MNIIGINGSPRKHKNSAQLLASALQGAEAKGAATETIHLIDLNYTGCISCFACKRIDGPSFGRCVIQDDLQPVLTKILTVDAMVLSMPIYFHDVPGMVRNLLERLWFPGLMYRKDSAIAYEKRVKVGLIYTMNAKDASRYEGLINTHVMPFNWLLGETKTMQSLETLQYDHYERYVGDVFDPAQRKERHQTVFPQNKLRAFELGGSLVTP